MKINAKTKISKLIESNPDAIDTIATINKHFKKLKNPLLRKVLANKVSIADAAKIGGVTTEMLIDRLVSIGFTKDDTDNSTQNNIKEASESDDFTGKEIVILDVRPELERGVDPFKSIMNAIRDLPDGKVLKIVNTFEPIPMINVLENKGYSFKIERPDETLVYTYFTKKKNAKTNKELPMDLVEDDPVLFEKVLKQFGDKIKETDVRGLEMPMPMVTILKEIEELPEDYVLFVHHKRIPQFLLDELAERNYNLIGKNIDEENVKLLIYKK